MGTIKDVLDTRKMSVKQLVDKTGLKLMRVNVLKGGKVKPTDNERIRICEALEVKAEDIFPKLAEQKLDASGEAEKIVVKPEPVKQEVEQKVNPIEAKAVQNLRQKAIVQIPFGMVESKSDCAPRLDNGFYVLKCVTFMNGKVEMASGGIVQRDQQWIIGTGIDYKSIPSRLTALIFPLDCFVIENELWVMPTPIEYNGQLAVVIYNHGKSLHLISNMEIARLKLVSL